MKKHIPTGRTAREILEDRLRPAFIVFFTGVGLIPCSFFAAAISHATLNDGKPGSVPWLSVFFIGLTILMVFVPVVVSIYIQNYIKCPWCGAGLQGLITVQTKFDRLKCCPFCARSFDDRMPVDDRGKSPSKPDPWDDEVI